VRVRVMVTAAIRPGDEAAFERDFAAMSARMKATPGLIRDELLRHSTGDDVMRGAEPEPDVGGTGYVLLSEWESREAFLAWERGSAHMRSPYWAGRAQRRIYDVAFPHGD
jgi:heme-degrading monooxygenase HmoA